MGFTDEAYELYFGPNFSKIKTYRFPELEIDIKRKFVQEFFLRSVFFEKFDKVDKPIVFYILRRIQQIIPIYIEARASLIELADSTENRINSYLNTVNKVEILISLLYQIYLLYFNLTGKKLFEENDGSSLQRLNRCYSMIKHLERSTITEGLLQSTYLDFDRFCTHASYITFQELHDFILEIVSFVDKIMAEN
jgi:hypothetical protein